MYSYVYIYIHICIYRERERFRRPRFRSDCRSSLVAPWWVASATVCAPWYASYLTCALLPCCSWFSGWKRISRSAFFHHSAGKAAGSMASGCHAMDQMGEC